MNAAEAAALLTICAGFDNRKPDADQAKAWSLALTGLRFIDCRDAVVAHYQRTRDWIMPFDVIKGVKKVRSERVLEHFSAFQPPHGCTDQEYDSWYRETVERIGDGELTAADAPGPPPAIGRSVIHELESRGLRTNTLPTAVVASRAEIARQAARASKAERQANTKPEPEPLMQPHEYSREPERTDHAQPTEETA